MLPLRAEKLLERPGARRVSAGRANPLRVPASMVAGARLIRPAAPGRTLATSPDARPVAVLDVARIFHPRLAGTEVLLAGGGRILENT
jgi:hypothetical protein